MRFFGRNLRRHSSINTCYIEHFFAKPDPEDLAYFAPIRFALSAEQIQKHYPGLDLPTI